MSSQIVTANRLGDGRVVYLAGDGAWREFIDTSRVARSDSEAALLVAEAARAVDDRQVVAPYLIEVETDNASVTPVRYRERLRALGPSIHPEFGRPSGAAESHGKR